MLNIGMITSEISQDFDYALQVISELGIDYIEIETLWDKSVGQLDADEINEAKQIIRSRGLRVCCLSPSFSFGFPCAPDRMNCHIGVRIRNISSDLKRLCGSGRSWM